jgi:2-oxoglutarate ferredoxin oxidoreductase subunit alpha
MNSKMHLAIKVAGESGMGINSTGELLSKALKNSGFYGFGYREYPSLIEGGYACYQIDLAEKSVNSSAKYVDLLVCISRESIFEYLQTLKPGGLLIHCLPRLNFNEKQKSFIEQNSIKVEYVDTERILKENYAEKVMTNTIMIGVLWRILELTIDEINSQIEENFAKKPKYIPINQKLAQIGFNEGALIADKSENDRLSLSNWPKNNSLKDAYILSGNHSLALGSVHAGVRAYYSYPMTPASSILSYLAEIEGETGMLVKQAEDEITAAQMAIGSMHMGTRAFTGTSGGGFDLMTESISLAGISETPMVVVLSQRPGPATGLPTWTAAADLELAIYSGHGEYPKCVIAASDACDAYELIQHSFNIAEKFQIPVILLTEKQIAESNFLVQKFYDVEINRSLVKGDSVHATIGDTDEYVDKRYSVDQPISKRWVPGTSWNLYLANSDEHNEVGDSIEDAETTKKMMEKRMEKLNLLQTAFPEPVLYGDIHADTILVGWGSVKNTVLDCLPEKGFAYLHYTYMYPIKVGTIEKFYKEGKKLILIENNFTGQLGRLIAQNSDVKFAEKVLKYDGRQFFQEEVENLISNSKIQIPN